MDGLDIYLRYERKESDQIFGHPNNRRWDETYERELDSRNKFDEGNDPYGSPVDMAITNAKAMLNRIHVERVYVKQGRKIVFDSDEE